MLHWPHLVKNSKSAVRFGLMIFNSANCGGIRRVKNPESSFLLRQSTPLASNTSCRGISSSAISCGQVSSLKDKRNRFHEEETDLKSDAINLFKCAVNSVLPNKMVKNVLQYDEITSVLIVDDKMYKLHRNIFIVGFGKATLGMARAVEDVLGEHIVSGVISIPRRLPKEMAEAERYDSLLRDGTKIQTYEGSFQNQVDEAAHNAAKAIQNLVSKLTEKDIVIVLCSGGGSVLCPAPHPPITINDLMETVKLLAHQGASMRDLNTVRKNIESLKGGGLVKAAKPAQVLCLILSSILGESVELMAGGATYPSQPTPRHCLEIMQRLKVTNKVPVSVKTFLDKTVRQMDVMQSNEKSRHGAKMELERLWQGVQNVIVGNNLVACEAAAQRAEEMGYLPLILTTKLQGEARMVGACCAKLAKFIMVSFNQRVSREVDSTLACLEVDLVASGMEKIWLNKVAALTDMAFHMNKDICIIFGGEMVVNVRGNGTGGKNMECALGAMSQIKEDFLEEEPISHETRMAFLSADTDGRDGVTKMAGAVIDKDFVAHTVKNGFDINGCLDNNDSLNLFTNANEGQNLIETKLTGTNVMDMLILLVKTPHN